ncbi:collagen alpha-2(I) chain-like [Phocoena phocoena]|uniref:collagen alpha-2(I) chain-like n=1 Tax=Phocoena phocoena TaxID=9742 RepID=UPI003306A339
MVAPSGFGPAAVGQQGRPGLRPGCALRRMGGQGRCPRDRGPRAPKPPGPRPCPTSSGPSHHGTRATEGRLPAGPAGRAARRRPRKPRCRHLCAGVSRHSSLRQKPRLHRVAAIGCGSGIEGQGRFPGPAGHQGRAPELGGCEPLDLHLAAPTGDQPPCRHLCAGVSRHSSLRQKSRLRRAAAAGCRSGIEGRGRYPGPAGPQGRAPELEFAAGPVAVLSASEPLDLHLAAPTGALPRCRHLCAGVSRHSSLRQKPRLHRVAAIGCGSGIEGQGRFPGPAGHQGRAPELGGCEPLDLHLAAPTGDQPPCRHLCAGVSRHSSLRQKPCLRRVAAAGCRSGNEGRGRFPGPAGHQGRAPELGGCSLRKKPRLHRVAAIGCGSGIEGRGRFPGPAGHQGRAPELGGCEPLDLHLAAPTGDQPPCRHLCAGVSRHSSLRQKPCLRRVAAAGCRSGNEGRGRFPGPAGHQGRAPELGGWPLPPRHACAGGAAPRRPGRPGGHKAAPEGSRTPDAPGVAGPDPESAAGPVAVLSASEPLDLHLAAPTGDQPPCRHLEPLDLHLAAPTGDQPPCRHLCASVSRHSSLRQKPCLRRVAAAGCRSGNEGRGRFPGPAGHQGRAPELGGCEPLDLHLAAPTGDQPPCRHLCAGVSRHSSLRQKPRLRRVAAAGCRSGIEGRGRYPGPAGPQVRAPELGGEPLDLHLAAPTGDQPPCRHLCAGVSRHSSLRQKPRLRRVAAAGCRSGKEGRGRFPGPAGHQGRAPELGGCSLRQKPRLHRVAAIGCGSGIEGRGRFPGPAGHQGRAPELGGCEPLDLHLAAPTGDQPPCRHLCAGVSRHSSLRQKPRLRRVAAAGCRSRIEGRGRYPGPAGPQGRAPELGGCKPLDLHLAAPTGAQPRCRHLCAGVSRHSSLRQKPRLHRVAAIGCGSGIEGRGRFPGPAGHQGRAPELGGWCAGKGWPCRG